MLLRGAIPDRSLDHILARVSRSFYLSLVVLPRAVRAQLSAAYLLARAADTIADTRLVRAAGRLELLESFRAALAASFSEARFLQRLTRELDGAVSNPAERLLLERLGECLRALAGFEAGDHARTLQVLATLIDGMEHDLRRFPEGRLEALETLEELDQHCYRAAGCVGEFWTRMMAAHLPPVRRLTRPDLLARGVRLGKALQLVNVLRDAPADLAQGRCYLPRALLSVHGLRPEVLLASGGMIRATPVLEQLCGLALAHVDAAWPYVLAIPASQPRLRLAAVWPLWIGLATLGRLRSAGSRPPADPVKISRADVYRIVAESGLSVGSSALLTLLHRRRRQFAAAAR